MSIDWLPVVGYEGSYLVSSAGDVRGVPRLNCDGRILKQGHHPRTNHAHVALSVNGKPKTRPVHLLVAEAFLGPRPEGLEIRHLDGNPVNNTPINLSYGTRSENSVDMVLHGGHHNARKTHCPSGHEYTLENAAITPENRRVCRACKKVRYLASKAS